MLGAQSGFKLGYKQLIARLFELRAIPQSSVKLPTEKAFSKACDKLPLEAVTSLLSASHKHEFTDNGRKFHGLKVIIADGTKISLPRSPSTLEKFGEAYGHYPQCLAVGFFELSTGSFEDFKLAHMDTAERTLAYEHMNGRSEKSLYVADAGYNGMAFIALANESGHEMLMPLKACKLAKEIRSSKKRSVIREIKLTRSQLKNYPDHKHLIGETIKVRLICQRR